MGLPGSAMTGTPWKRASPWGPPGCWSEPGAFGCFQDLTDYFELPLADATGGDHQIRLMLIDGLFQLIGQARRVVIGVELGDHIDAGACCQGTQQGAVGIGEGGWSGGVADFGSTGDGDDAQTLFHRYSLDALAGQ